MVQENIGREDKRKKVFMKGASKYTKPYLELSPTCQKMRIREIAMETLFVVIDRKVLKDEGVEWM